MTASFLNQRKMRFKVNAELSSERLICGGSPQGTKLGNLLFIITINTIEDGHDFTPPHIEDSNQDGGSAEEEEDTDCLGLRNIASRISAVRRFDSGVGISSTPRKMGTTDGVLRYLDESGRDNSTISIQPPERVMMPLKDPLEPWVDKYVDDVNVGERNLLANAVVTISQSKIQKNVRAYECERLFQIISGNSTSIGMKVNKNKTQLLCLSGSTSSCVSSYIMTGDDEIKSGDTMTLLGFRFSSRPSVCAHIDLIRKKFQCRSWLIRHLKQAGVQDQDLVTIFSTIIRPVIEYASPVYGPMLGQGQVDELEKMQRMTLKIIYGHRVSYKRALERAGIPTLEER